MRIGYARVSTQEQDNQLQITALKETGCELIFQEKASGGRWGRPELLRNIFGEDIDPVGKTIRIKQSPFVILGVLDSKGQTLDGRDQDDTIIVPLTTDHCTT